MVFNSTSLFRTLIFGCLVVAATFNFASAQTYCIPSDTPSNTTHGINSVLTALAYSNFSNTNTGLSQGGYIYYNYDTVTVLQNTSFTLQASSILGHSHWAAWIDWNADGDFADPGELVYQNNNNFSPDFSANINVPNGISDSLRLRIMALYSGNATNPCATGIDGEVEDYLVKVFPNTTQIQNSSETPALRVYPNPTQNFTTIEARNPESLKKATLINTLGQKVYETLIDGNKQLLRLNHLPNGIYLLQIQTNKGFSNQRLQIIR